MMFIKNLIALLLRDIIVLGSGDFIEYTVERNVLVYKSWLPFNISIGNYVFLSKKSFIQSFNK